MKITSIVAVLLVCVLTPACEQQNNPVGPSLADLTGRWTGNSTYPNAPFELSLLQSDGTLRGEYADRLDSSHAVTGTFSNPTVAIVVDFGDAKLNLQGTVGSAGVVQGVMFTPALGNREYPFTMTR